MFRRTLAGFAAALLGKLLDQLIKVWRLLVWFSDDSGECLKEFDRAQRAVVREFTLHESKAEDPDSRGDD